jgi:mRNA interferase HigB
VVAHADARPWIENWVAELERTQWKTPQDVKNMYASASFLAGNVVIFNVKGNRYEWES